MNVTVNTKTEKSRAFFEKIWLKVAHIETNKFTKVLKTIYNFFFNIKQFNLDAKKSWTSYEKVIIFWLEWIFIVALIYFFSKLLIPVAKIEINPAQENETVIYNFRYYPAENIDYPRYSRFLSIPFYTWTLDYSYDLSINTDNIKYLQTPSIWEVKIFNKTNW